MIQSRARHSIVGIYGWIQLSASQLRADPIYRNTRNEASQLSLLCDNDVQSRTISRNIFLRSDNVATRCMSMCGYYSRAAFFFIGKPADINDGRIRYAQVIQPRLLDAGSSTRNLSVLLSAMEKSFTTRTALGSLVTVVRINHVRVCVPRVAAATIRRWGLANEIR